MSTLKIFITSGFCLLIGLAIGYFTGYRHYDRHITNEAVKQMRVGMESSDREHAAEATRVVELIESGDNSNAVRMLKIPIANYYQLDAADTNTDGERPLRATIEQLASTNQIIADAIHGTNQ